MYFWLKAERSDATSRAEFRKALEELLHIPGIVRGFVGAPAPVKPRPVVDSSYDFALSLVFDSIADHDAYQTAPAHVAFLEAYRDWWNAVRIYDLA